MTAIAGMLCLEHGVLEVEDAERLLPQQMPNLQQNAEEGSYRSPSARVALAVRSLAKAGHLPQPASNESHTIWAVLSGDLINARALRHSLELMGVQFRNRSQSELIIRAYEQWGSGFVRHLQGAFVLALWDDRCNRLVLARDVMGNRALYYAEVDGKLCFSTRLEPILAQTRLPRRIHATALAEYLNFGHVNAPLTLVSGIYKLKAGQCLIAEGLSPIRLDQFAHALPDLRRVEMVQKLHPDQHAANLRTLLECALADRMDGDAMLAVHMPPQAGAGALASLTSRLSGRQVHALTVLANDDVGGLMDATHLSRTTAIRLDEVLIGADILRESFDDLVDAMAEPNANMESPAWWFAVQGAMCGGIGFDCGLIPIMGLDPRLYPARGLAKLFNFGRNQALTNHARAPFGPKGGNHLIPYCPELKAQNFKYPDWMTDFQHQALQSQHVPAVMDGLAPLIHGFCAQNGRYALLPFWDENLLAYSLTLPKEQRAHMRGARQMLRRVFGDLVPATLLARPRESLSLPMFQWLEGPLAGWADQKLQSFPLFAPARLESLLRSPHVTQSVWALLVLVQWCRKLGLSELDHIPRHEVELAEPMS